MLNLRHSLLICQYALKSFENLYLGFMQVVTGSEKAVTQVTYPSPAVSTETQLL
jgi:hypothetical protein